MACAPAGLAALSHLANLKELSLGSLGYREPHPAGHSLFLRDDKRLTARVWEMIAARKAGAPLPDAWLALAETAVQSARNRQATKLETQALALRKQADALLAKAKALLEQAEKVRAGRGR